VTLGCSGKHTNHYTTDATVTWSSIVTWTADVILSQYENLYSSFLLLKLLFYVIYNMPCIYLHLWARIAVSWSGYEMDDRSLTPGTDWGFLCTTVSRPALGPTQHPTQWVQGLFPVGKAGHKADRSLIQISAAFKNKWKFTSTLSYIFMAWCLIKQLENSTSFTFLNCSPIFAHTCIHVYKVAHLDRLKHIDFL
jgi:hypothetical protein